MNTTYSNLLFDASMECSIAWQCLRNNSVCQRFISLLLIWKISLSCEIRNSYETPQCNEKHGFESKQLFRKCAQWMDVRCKTVVQCVVCEIVSIINLIKSNSQSNLSNGCFKRLIGNLFDLQPPSRVEIEIHRFDSKFSLDRCKFNTHA